jgi:hypothetical protein
MEGKAPKIIENAEGTLREKLLHAAKRPRLDLGSSVEDRNIVTGC